MYRFDWLRLEAVGIGHFSTDDILEFKRRVTRRLIFFHNESVVSSSKCCVNNSLLTM